MKDVVTMTFYELWWEIKCKGELRLSIYYRPLNQDKVTKLNTRDDEE